MVSGGYLTILKMYVRMYFSIYYLFKSDSLLV